MSAHPPERAPIWSIAILLALWSIVLPVVIYHVYEFVVNFGAYHPAYYR